MENIFKSIRAFLAFLFGLTFCIGFLLEYITPKDFTPVVMLAVTFYFVLKDRTNGHTKG